MNEAVAGTSRYEVLAKIATGGMATVYVGRARGPAGFSRLVAVKCPHPFVSEDRDLRRHIEEEARAASLIHHANVVSVLDLEMVDGAPVLVLEYVEGATFAEFGERLNERPVEERWPVAMRVVLDSAAGLWAAHSQQVQRGAALVSLDLVHRDVTPHNVLVGRDGVSRLTDFGLAKTNDVSREKTATNVVKGKLGYLPPEYLSGRRFTARGDQFSLAVVAWESLAGEKLFRGNNGPETILLVANARVPKLAERDRRLAAFDPVLARALAVDPAARFDTVEDFANALEAVAHASVGVASRAQVTAAVIDAFEPEFLARRDVIEHATPTALADRVAFPLTSARDEMATLSISDNRHARSGATTRRTAIVRDSWRRRSPFIAGGIVLLAAGLVGFVLHAKSPQPKADLAPQPVADVDELDRATSAPPPQAVSVETPVAPAHSAPPAPAIADRPARSVRRGPTRPAPRAPAPAKSAPRIPDNPY